MNQPQQNQMRDNRGSGGPGPGRFNGDKKLSHAGFTGVIGLLLAATLLTGVIAAAFNYNTLCLIIGIVLMVLFLVTSILALLARSERAKSIWAKILLIIFVLPIIAGILLFSVQVFTSEVDGFRFNRDRDKNEEDFFIEVAPGQQAFVEQDLEYLASEYNALVFFDNQEYKTTNDFLAAAGQFGNRVALSIIAYETSTSVNGVQYVSAGSSWFEDNTYYEAEFRIDDVQAAIIENQINNFNETILENSYNYTHGEMNVVVQLESISNRFDFPLLKGKVIAIQ